MSKHVLHERFSLTSVCIVYPGGTSMYVYPCLIFIPIATSAVGIFFPTDEAAQTLLTLYCQTCILDHTYIVHSFKFIPYCFTVHASLFSLVGCEVAVLSWPC